MNMFMKKLKDLINLQEINWYRFLADIITDMVKLLPLLSFYGRGPHENVKIGIHIQRF